MSGARWRSCSPWHSRPITMTSVLWIGHLCAARAEARSVLAPLMDTCLRSRLAGCWLNPFLWRAACARFGKSRRWWAFCCLRAAYRGRQQNAHHRPFWKEQEMVGILLPASVGGALVNYAATLMGVVPVNLNYTANNDVINSCARQCKLQTVVTSRAFLERFPGMEVPGRTLLLEEMLGRPGIGEKLTAILFAWTLPFRLLKKALGARHCATEDLATIIFSSGSTGDPKGVMLTHHNILANIRQVTQVFMLGANDRVLGILPFFHSFGFTATLWLSAVHRIGVVFHPNPLDAKSISELVSRYRVTFLIATPTFLQAYMRRCSPEHFGSLQYVLVGAEKLPERVALAFEDLFGIRPLEGYGCTECSPVVAV